jgi:hypothetical protein
MMPTPPAPEASGTPTTASVLENAFGMLVLTLVGAAAIAHRIYLIVATDFPINDGGLFVAFIRAVAAHFPGLPADVAFNGLTIPFAYPPLSFWLAAGLSRAGGEPIAIVHVAPILMNLLYVLLFALLLIRSGRSLLFAALALLFFITTLRSFEWLVMGGGLSRGLGSLFLIATLLAVRVPDFARSSLPRWRLVVAGAAVAGGMLSHLEWGIDAAAALVLARALGCRSIRLWATDCLIAGATALLLVAPWLWLVIARHGLAPFVAASGTTAWGIDSVRHVVMLIELSLANPLIPIGAVVLLIRRQFFWPGFLLICMLLTPRHAPTPMILPIALFAAQGAFTFCSWLRRASFRPNLAAAATAVICAAIVTAGLDRSFLAQGPEFRPLDPPVREAMAWVARTHPGSSFLVLTSRPWWYDSSAEWFPLLAGARSLNTLQGREWLPGDSFAVSNDKDVALKASRTCAERIDRIGVFERSDFIWAETGQACFAEAGLKPVYRNAAVTIFAR